jgi:hypothetical protein
MSLLRSRRCGSAGSTPSTPIGRRVGACARPAQRFAAALADGARNARYHVSMSTHADRAAEQRRLKLDEIKAQVKAGSLTIRQMTPKERKSFPPVPPKERKERGR